MDCRPPGSSVHGISLTKDTGVVLLQGVIPTQGGNFVSRVGRGVFIAAGPGTATGVGYHFTHNWRTEEIQKCFLHFWLIFYASLQHGQSFKLIKHQTQLEMFWGVHFKESRDELFFLKRKMRLTLLGKFVGPSALTRAIVEAGTFRMCHVSNREPFLEHSPLQIFII